MRVSKSSAALFLVLLRLAIGWHFLFEGLDKVHSLPSARPRPIVPSAAPATSEKPTGPLVAGCAAGSAIRTRRPGPTIVLPQPEGPMENPNQFVPPALAQGLGRLLRTLLALRPRPLQRDEAEKRLPQAKNDVVIWMTWDDKKGPRRRQGQGGQRRSEGQEDLSEWRR